MSLKFASNLSFMFTEASSIIERYKLAKEAGFRAVESGFPFGFSIKDVSEAQKNAHVEQILINVFTGMYLTITTNAKHYTNNSKKNSLILRYNFHFIINM